MEVIRKHFDTIDSTNTWAKNNSHLLAHNKMTLITADSQTGGRGRFKREWKSPSKQNIYASFCFFIEKHRQDIGNIPQVLALSTAKTLEQLHFTPKLKWPNDILLEDKKVGGILTETTPLSDQLCIIVGIGLNINMPAAELKQIDRPATSLLVEAGQTFDVEEVLQRLQKQFLADLDHFLDEGFYSFLAAYRKHMQRDPNALVRFSDNKTIWEGTIEAINDDGSLNLRLHNGEVKTFFTGEILS